MAPKSPTKEMAPKSPTKEMAPKSPTKEIALESSTEEVAPRSPTKDVAPKSPTKEVSPKSPTKEVSPKSPEKEVVPKSPTKEVVPKSPTKEVAPKSPTKEVAPKSPTKEVAPKSPTKEVVPKSPMKEVASRSPSKEIASKSPIKEAPSTLASRDAASKSPSPAKGTFPRSPDKEASSKSPEKEILRSPLKEVAPKFTEKESRATPTSPLKETVPRSPDREVKVKSSTKEVISVSPARDVAPRSPTKETSPVKDVARKSPAKEVSPKFPVKEVVTSTPAKQTPRKSPTKEVSSRLPIKESSQKTPPREDSSKLPVRPTDRKAPAKMPPGHLDKTEGEILPTTEVSTFSSTEVVVKQTFTEYRKDYEAELVVGQKLPLRTLVQRDAMAPRNFLVFIPSSGRTMRLEDALATWQVTEDNIVMVRSMNELVVMDQVAPEFTLDSATSEGMYNTQLKTFTNPKTKKPISFAEFVARKFVDFSNVTVQDFKTRKMITLEEALERNIVDRETGQMVHPETKKPVSFFEASVLGWIVWETTVVTQTRQLTLAQAIRGLSFDQEKAAAQERCKSCDEEIAQLSQWIEDIELRLANLGAVSEDSDSLRQQLSTAKSLREELELKQPRVLSLFDEVRQLSSSELLSRDETDALQRPLAQCRGRLELCQERSERLARRLAAALEELLKYTGEMQVFRTWLDNARKVLARHEELLDDIRNVADNADHYRAFSSDVIAHQADLRFITMAAQRFVDESKEYLRMLNDHRTSLPQRLSHLEPSESEVRAEVSHVSTEYQNLLSRVNKLGDQFSSLTERKRAYHEAMERATAWLNEAQRSAKRLLEEPTAAEPPAIQEQLERVRAFHLEAVGQGRLIETAKQAAQVLPPSGGPAVEEAVRNLEEVYQQMLSLVGERSKQLQTALVQSQDIADGLDRVLRLLDELEATQRGQSAKLASLMRDRLDEQIHEHRVLRSEIDGQRPFIDALNASARELPGNARLAKKVEAKLKDINSRYEKVLDKSTRRGELLDEVSSCLDQFTGMANRFEEWLASVLQAVEGEEQPRLEHAMNQRNLRKDEFEDLLRAGRALCAKRDVTDTGPVRDKVKQLEQQWKELGELLSERERQGRQRAEQGAAYETLRQQVLSWLQTTEGRLDSLGSLALDKDILRRQAAEIKPLVKEHAEYASTMDRVNELGRSYDALRVDSRSRPPARKGGSPHKEPYANGAHDLSPVQQQLSEMNHRYHLLGVRLSDRQQEADSLSEELRTCTEALRTLLAFVKSRSVPRDLPASQELAHQQLTQLRELQTELQEKQLEVDRARLQAQELLRRRPQAPGSDALQSQLDELLSRWQGLQGALRSRLLLIQLLKEFQDTHDLLHNWLIQKDKMFQVLGPIATEPRLVAAQTQQVLCMRDELTSQEPLLRRLTTCAQELLDQLDDKDGPTARRLREQLDGIKRHWAEMVSRLEERERALGAATGASAEFQTVLARLLDSLQGVGDDFERLSEAGDCEAQLRRLAALEERLEAQRPPLAEAEARAENLCELLSDAASRSEVRARLGSAQKLYNGLNRKINNRKAELESSLKEDRGFFSNCDSIQEWLRGIQLSLAPDLKISADTDILHKQVTEFEPAYKSLLDKEHEVHLVLSKGADMVTRMSRKQEAQQLRTRLDGLRRGWDQLRKEATDRHTRLQRAFENCKKFNAAFNKFGPWLQSAEGRLSTLTLVNYQRAEVERQAKELQAFKNDLSRHSQEYDSVRNLGETFLAGCDVDKEGVKKDLDTLRTRWEKLNHGVTERSRQLDEVSSKLCEFQEKAGELGHGLQRLEDKLASHDALGEAARNPRLLDRLQGMAREADELRRGLDRLRAFTDTWLASASPDCDTSHIRSQLDALVRRHQQLAHDLQDRCGQLEEAGTVVAQYHAKVKTAQQDLSNLEEELESMGPIGRDIKTVRSQIDQVKSFQERLSSAAREVDKAEQECQELISQGYTQDAKGARAQVETLRRQLNRLEERARGRHSSLEAMLAKLEKFYEDLHTTQRRVGSALGEEHTFRPVAADVESLRSQQEQFKQFRKSHVEPLGREVDNVNRAGNALIQSASPGVNTTLLERDIDKLNDEWNQLKEKVGERERLLEAALLQSGKFQEALAGVARWLEDTEELVANQRAPSADYKVLKAQLQEQKFLNKLLLDRQGSMNSLQAMGTEVMRHLSSADKAHVQAQLHDLSQRFDRLVRGAQERTAALERTLPVARSFQEQLSPLVEWLEQTERRLTAMSTLPTDADRLAQRAQEHRELHRDVLGHKRAFEALTETAQQLMSLVGDDEAQAVVDSLQELTDRYARLVGDSEHLEQLLTEARAGAGAFALAFEDLLVWIGEMESRLARYQVLSVYVEKLQEQFDELNELSEEVSDHQKQVDELSGSGQELMRHASGNDAIQLKDRLDSLQLRYTDLAQRAAERLRQAREALPVAQNFHTAHERLTRWMDDAEAQLRSLEAAALTAQESTMQRLEQELQEMRSVLEVVNHLGPQLCQRSPGEGAGVVESMVSRANRRFDAICEQIQRRAERLELSRQRSLEVTGDLEDLLDWFHEVERQLADAQPIVAEPDTLAAMLREQKALSEEVSSQKGRVRDVLSAAKKVAREWPAEDQAAVRDRAEELRALSTRVAEACAERLAALEQALPLAEHLLEAHSELVAWLDEAESEAERLAAPAAPHPAHIQRQQERNRALLQALAEHKPLLDRLNKAGTALAKLCRPPDAQKVQRLLSSDNERYNALRKLLRDQQNLLEEAMQSTSQFADKLDGMLSALASTADQLNNAEPISAHPERIQEQISDNQAVVSDLGKKSPALEAVQKAAREVIAKAGGDQEPSVRDIRQKLERLNGLWEAVQQAARTRGQSLESALAVAERFWEELNAVMRALRDLQENLDSQEPPAVEPQAIHQQQEVLHEIKQEMEQTRPEVDQCRQAGQDLMQLCGEPDRPEVKRHIEDLDTAWENVTTLYAKREQNLIDALDKAMGFHDTLQNLLEFLDTAEQKFGSLGPVAADIDAVKAQIGQLRDFKREVDPHMVEVESLNRQAKELSEQTSSEQARALRQPLDEINRRWTALLRGLVDRQRELENALLRLGQFQHALGELLVWMARTERALDECRPVAGDAQVIEVELAKHKVLMNDIQAHQSSVDTLNRAGHQLIEADRHSEDASVTQTKLADLNRRWKALQDKAAERQQQLEAALREAQAFNQEIQDLLMWLSDIDGQLASSKPVGGLPETAREQLNRFMELYNELDSNRHRVESVLQQGQEYTRAAEGSTGLQHSLRTLKQRWDNVLNRANDRKIKLEIALKEATEFHESLQEFVEWLTHAEKSLASLRPVSRVLENVLSQIEEHKSFQKDVGAHRETMLQLDKKGTHLKYFSQKQDVILIKNLLISVQHRWERVVSKAAERTRALDHGYKEAKEFHDAWTELDRWLTEADQSLDEQPPAGNDPEKIRRLLARHREFQRTLGAKQPAYDACLRQGRLLRERCPKADQPVLQRMSDELKAKWNALCNKSVDRQRKLEEALLFSGQFKDAVQALIDWLDRALTSLQADQLLHGDLDTVNNLVEQHRSFQTELKSRSANLESVQRTASELLKTASADDAASIRSQMSSLESKWEAVSKLSDTKQRKLEEALRQAEQLHKAVHMLLEWLSDAEMKLRFAGPLPEDEATTRQQMEEHQQFMREMEQQEHNKESTIALAQEILSRCHPDAVTVIRHWVTIIQSRWEEVSLWARQREQKLAEHLRSLRDVLELLEELMRWLLAAEASLMTLEAQPLPDDVAATERLLEDHRRFMDDMSQRQADVDRISKAFASKRQPAAGSAAAGGTKDRPSQQRHDRRMPHAASQSTPRTSTPTRGHAAAEPEIRHPRARELVEKWQHVWLLAMERQRRLLEHLKYLQELESIKNFDFDEWRRRFLGWMNNKKSRVMDLFRKIDKDNDGKVTKEEFIEGILKSKFPTSRLEMERVADIFDRNGDGYIDHKEYIDTLRPDRDCLVHGAKQNKPLTEAEKIQDEVQRQVAKCTCVHRFKVFQVGEGKYRFGESQKLRLVRILRSTVMVRVGGGWVALDEFLVKNDPCRGARKDGTQRPPEPAAATAHCCRRRAQ
uniref:Short stop n=1 Tax=Rhipicephalus zambeziensis TaxID=60191 RepID=A0A224Z7W8_9ACAR